MRFERLQVPNLALPIERLKTAFANFRSPFDMSRLPDLVAFNARVHRRIDPWFARKWVRRLAWLGAGGFAFFAAVWLFFASGLPSSETLLAYQPPLPTNVRGHDGNPVQTFARERRVELAYDEYPPLVVDAFVSAEDKTFFSHGGIDYPGLIGAVFVAATLGLGGSVQSATDDRLEPQKLRLVYLALPGPGGGGGGGGLKKPAPPPKAERKGQHTLSSPLPVRQPPPAPKPPPPLPEVEPEPLPPVQAPVVAIPSDTRDRAGVLEETPPREDSRGPGTDGGVGTGRGTGIDEGPR